MDLMNAAMGSLSMASSAQMMRYSYGITNMAMKEEVKSARSMINGMLPQQQSFRVRGPQTGDVPTSPKGHFFDVYA